jgi:GDP-mannose pyrophosphatase NudK
MNESVKVLSTSVLSDQFFTLENIEFETQHSDGSTVQQKREVYHTANGATVLLYNRSKRAVILIRQLRIASHINGNHGGMMIEACAGIIEENDDPASTIIREIEEETGYIVTDVKKLFELHSSPGATTEKLFYFLAEYDPGKRANDGGGLDEEEEDIEVLELPFEEAYNMIENGDIKDAKTVILLQYARLYVFPPEKVFNVL